MIKCTIDISSHCRAGLTERQVSLGSSLHSADGCDGEVVGVVRLHPWYGECCDGVL